MKTIIRNLLGVVRRFKMATLLNVMGLSIAFAAFIILMIQLQYDWGFDRFQKNAERIYRVGLYTPDWGNQVVVSPPFAEAFVQSSPHIETGALLSSWGSQLALKRGNDTNETSFWCPVNAITPEYASVFDFQMLEGKIESLDNPGYVRFDSQKDKGNKTMVFVLFTIAVLIVVIAGINFTNFSNALVPMRIRSINTQKVLGGSDNTLRCAMLVEAVAICLFSFILSLFIVKGMANTWLADMVSGELSLKANIPLLIGAGVLAALTGLLAGAYPAWHITSFSPALVLKGSFGLSPSGKRMRSLLVSFQYVISFALIIAALFIYLQNHYMLASSLGFDKEHVAIVELNGQLIKNIEAVENRLEQEVSVQEVSFAEDLLSASDEYTDFGRGYRENNVQFKVFVVSPDFLRLMNIPVISGRDFLQEDSKSVGGVYLFNEAARLQYDLVAGEYITGNEWYEAPPALIAGFIDDIKYASFRTEVAPMAFYVSPAAGYRPRYAYIKIKAGADIRDAVASIRKALTSIDKNFPAEIRFYDTILNNLYKRELSIGWLISLFSLIAVFISVVGVLGLVIFESEYRKKEIGLRKVHGATTSQILLMFNKVYVRILIVCFVLAIPVAYYGVNRWMVYFAYKIPMYWWVYAVAFVVVSVITFLTVTFQNWKTANENPVESIKTE